MLFWASSCTFCFAHFSALNVLRRLISPIGSNWFRWQGATGVTAFILGECKRNAISALSHAGGLTSFRGCSKSFTFLVILQLRLYALYNLNKKVLTLMGSVFVSAVVASSVIMGFSLSKIQGLFRPLHFYLPLDGGQSDVYHAVANMTFDISGLALAPGQAHMRSPQSALREVLLRVLDTDARLRERLVWSCHLPCPERVQKTFYARSVWTRSRARPHT